MKLLSVVAAASALLFAGVASAEPSTQCSNLQLSAKGPRYVRNSAHVTTRYTIKNVGSSTANNLGFSLLLDTTYVTGKTSNKAVKVFKEEGLIESYGANITNLARGKSLRITIKSQVGKCAEDAVSFLAAVAPYEGACSSTASLAPKVKHPAGWTAC